ncbi:unnamed protein product [Dovyalis caffra]|uniref:KIB1-4 beta-propeller domain-containing protein n=1 Tax=Dovyalis caffra TaxID=77055 RepID=A0AAV1QR46_9ROSI|nr:unnamed protein product [Dovyalis caffra]
MCSSFSFTVALAYCRRGDRTWIDISGELLLVHCQKYLNPNTGNGKASSFEVYKFNTNVKRRDPVTSLGEYALFLGRGQSFALSELKVSGMKGNHIYYAEDFTDPCSIRKLRPCDGDNEIIVYSLENSNLEFLQSPFPSEKPYGMWFTPSLGGR